MRVRKRFAQHFLEAAWVAKLVDAVGGIPSDAMIEIGPGRGAITRPLSARVGRMLAIEIDRDLAGLLQGNRPANVTVVTADVLDVDLPTLLTEWLGAVPSPANPVRFVGNLPYNITSPIMFKLIEYAAESGAVTDATLMLQKEVADRLVAKVDTREYGVLTILTGLHAQVTRLLTLPPGAFRPAPSVWSAVVRLRFRPSTVAPKDAVLFTRMVRTVFTQRRKTLANGLKPFVDGGGLSAMEALTTAGIDPRRRPETLQLVELVGLADVFAAGRA